MLRSLLEYGMSEWGSNVNTSTRVCYRQISDIGGSAEFALNLARMKKESAEAPKGVKVPADYVTTRISPTSMTCVSAPPA